MFKYWYTLYTRQTESETFLERHIPKLGVRYRTQHPVLSAKAILDFYFPDYFLAVEVDDPGHLRKAQIKKDQERNIRLEALGIKTIRFSNKEVLTSPEYVLSAIQKEISSRPESDGVNKSVGIWSRTRDKEAENKKKRENKNGDRWTDQITLTPRRTCQNRSFLENQPVSKGSSLEVVAPPLPVN